MPAGALHEEREAREHSPAIYQNSAGATGALVAALLCPRQLQALSQGGRGGSWGASRGVRRASR